MNQLRHQRVEKVKTMKLMRLLGQYEPMVWTWAGVGAFFYAFAFFPIAIMAIYRFADITPAVLGSLAVDFFVGAAGWAVLFGAGIAMCAYTEGYDSEKLRALTAKGKRCLWYANIVGLAVFAVAFLVPNILAIFGEMLSFARPDPGDSK
jgi:hypothetical protein